METLNAEEVGNATTVAVGALDVEEKHLRFMNSFDQRAVKPLQYVELIDRICCHGRCDGRFSKFDVYTVRSRLSCDPMERIYQQFFLIQTCVGEDGIQLRLEGKTVCKKFFCAVVALPEYTFDRFIVDYLKGRHQGGAHGNTGRRMHSDAFYDDLAKVVYFLDCVAQESPTGNEYYAPPCLTKRECVEIATGKQYKRNSSHPYRLLKELAPRVHFRKTNDLTKCNICVELNTGLHNGRWVDGKKAEAVALRLAHYENVKADRSDYALRKLFSVNKPCAFLSVAHDGMTKMHTKIPHLLEDRAKLLADKDLAFCDLNVALVHRPISEGSSQELPFSLHGYFNLCGANVGGTNSVLSQLLDAVSRTKQIPSTVAFQVDNFGPNKSYVLLGALGWFLRVQSVVREFYVAYNEVGHTHIDIDACFGRFSKRLDRSQCPSPQAMQQEFQKLNGVQRSALLYTVYDFESIVANLVLQFGCIRKNHFFRVFVDHRGIPSLQIARFVRSENWIKPSPTSDAFLLFRRLPPKVPLPAVVAIDREKIMKLDDLVGRCCTILSARELANIVSAKEVYLDYVGEPFQELLNRFQANASVDLPAAVHLADQENQLVGRFLAEDQSAIRRIWNEKS
uniref:DUF7869 domain-containing protein n=1 Tax=Ditylenchus dipsaci TaxID=166011 RepID=A0A915DTE2_9BILA